MYTQTSHYQSTQTSHNQSIKLTHVYQTPQHPLFCFQNESMSQFNQPDRPLVTQQMRSNYDNMGTELDYSSVCNSQEMLDFIDDTHVPGTSLQTPQMDPGRYQTPQMNHEREQSPQGNHVQPQRRRAPPNCGIKCPL